jgi:hypothetical protein
VDAYYGLVGRLAKGFEKAKIEYAFTGALAPSFMVLWDSNSCRFPP